MIARKITYSALTVLAIACIQNIDAAQRRRSKAKKPKTGTMSLVELREHKKNLTSLIDWKTGEWYNQPIFSSDSLPSFGTEEDQPVKEPSCVITRGDMQKKIAQANACAPLAGGTLLCLAGGNPMPLCVGIAATNICYLLYSFLGDRADVAAEETATRKDLSTIIDAVEHDRWAKQHPRLSLLCKRGDSPAPGHLKSE